MQRGFDLSQSIALTGRRRGNALLGQPGNDAGGLDGAGLVQAASDRTMTTIATPPAQPHWRHAPMKPGRFRFAYPDGCTAKIGQNVVRDDGPPSPTGRGLDNPSRGTGRRVAGEHSRRPIWHRADTRFGTGRIWWRREWEAPSGAREDEKAVPPYHAARL